MAIVLAWSIAFADHVFLTHVSPKFWSIFFADVSTDCLPMCRATVGGYVGRYSVDLSA